MKFIVKQWIVDAGSCAIREGHLRLLVRDRQRDYWLISRKRFCPVPEWKSQFYCSILVFRFRRRRKFVRDRFGDALQLLLLNLSDRQ